MNFRGSHGKMLETLVLVDGAMAIKIGKEEMTLSMPNAIALTKYLAANLDAHLKAQDEADEERERLANLQAERKARESGVDSVLTDDGKINTGSIPDDGYKEGLDLPPMHVDTSEFEAGLSEGGTPTDFNEEAGRVNGESAHGN